MLDYNFELRFAPIYIPAAPSSSTLAGYTTTSAASTAALQVVPDTAFVGAGGGGAGYTLDFYATGAECYVIFGPDNTVPDATLLCMAIPVGQVQPYFVNAARRFMKVIATGAGTLRWVPRNK